MQRSMSSVIFFKVIVWFLIQISTLLLFELHLVLSGDLNLHLTAPYAVHSEKLSLGLRCQQQKYIA